MTLSLTTTPLEDTVDRDRTVEFEIDGEEFVFLAPKDSVFAMRLLRSKPQRTAPSVFNDPALDEIIDKAQVLFDTVRVGLDLADRAINGRKIDEYGDPTDRVRPAGDDGTWVDPGPTQWERIASRLEDPGDPLELRPVVDLFRRLMDAARTAGDEAERPPTSSNA